MSPLDFTASSCSTARSSSASAIEISSSASNGFFRDSLPTAVDIVNGKTIRSEEMRDVDVGSSPSSDSIIGSSLSMHDFDIGGSANSISDNVTVPSIKITKLALNFMLFHMQKRTVHDKLIKFLVLVEILSDNGSKISPSC